MSPKSETLTPVERATAALEGRSISRLYPPPHEELAVTDVYSDLEFPSQDTQTLPYVYLNMVSSLDGRVATGGKASTIGSAADRLLMDNLRSRADAVMIGAGTLRAEKLTLAVSPHASARRVGAGLSPQPLAVIVSGSSDLSQAIDENLLHSKPDNTLMFVSRKDKHAASLKAGSKIHVVQEPPDASEDGGLVDLHVALRTLRRDYGVRHLLVEGGPRINACLLSAGIVREIFLTLSPKILGGGGSITSLIENHDQPKPESTTDLQLISVHLLESEIFLRYALSTEPPYKDITPK